MRSRWTLHRRARLAVLCLMTAGALGSWLLSPRAASADASSCTLHPETMPLDDGSCGYPGDGCYLCDIYHTGDPGYQVCAESPDGTIKKCKPGLHPFNQYSGSQAAPAPTAPAHGNAGSQVTPLQKAQRAAARPADKAAAAKAEEQSSAPPPITGNPQ